MLSFEKQVIGQALSIALYRAGIRMTSQFYWIDNKLVAHDDLLRETPTDKPYSAYTTAELGEIIPYQLLDGEFTFRIIKDQTRWISLYVARSKDMTLYSLESINLTESLGRLILYLIKDGYLSLQDIAA